LQSFATPIKCIDTTDSKAVTSSLVTKVSSGGCKNFYGYKSYKFLGLYCLPVSSWVNTAATSLAGTVNKLDDAFGALGQLHKWVDDLIICWPVILGGFCAAVIIGIIYCYFMRCCAAIITWIILITLLAVLWLGGWLAYHTGQKYQTDIDNANTAATNASTSTTTVTADTSDDEWTRNWCYVAAGVLWFFALVFTCCVLCNFHRIRLIINIIKASARFINNNLMILFVPVINTLIALGWFVLWF